MRFTHRQLREAFHLLFLERLLKLTDPRLYVLKGGANLRFFFGSPRYSEDMDIDVLGGSVATLKKNGYRVLEDRAFRRSLEALGVVEVEVNDPHRAKHTATTQRFQVGLVTAGESWPTKVEFSRRQQLRVRDRESRRLAPSRGESAAASSFVTESVSPAVTGAYRQLAFRCQHYSGHAAVAQKLSALVNRSEPQVRDAFDLHVLWLGGHWDRSIVSALPDEERARAMEVLVSFSFADYTSQVVDYLEPAARDEFAGAERWDRLCAALLELLDLDAP